MDVYTVLWTAEEKPTRIPQGTAIRPPDLGAEGDGRDPYGFIQRPVDLVNTAAVLPSVERYGTPRELGKALRGFEIELGVKINPRNDLDKTDAGGLSPSILNAIERLNPDEWQQMMEGFMNNSPYTGE